MLRLLPEDVCTHSRQKKQSQLANQALYPQLSDSDYQSEAENSTKDLEASEKLLGRKV